MTEISCIITSSCSWMTSTDSFGRPDWVLSSVSVLVSQERQQLLLENSSSQGGVEGRQLQFPHSEHLLSPSTSNSNSPAAIGVDRLRPQSHIFKNTAICWFWCATSRYIVCA